MSVESTDADADADADTDDDGVTDRFERELLAILRGLGEGVEPWKLRPAEDADEPAKLLVGAREDLVRGRLEGAGYEVRDLELPVERDGWLAAWEVSSG